MINTFDQTTLKQYTEALKPRNSSAAAEPPQPDQPKYFLTNLNVFKILNKLRWTSSHKPQYYSQQLRVYFDFHNRIGELKFY